jgi:hypothetical protein
MTVHYDPKCEELARYFLASEASVTESNVASLAGTIQRAIEGWLEDWDEGRTPTAPKEPDDESGQE